MKEPHVKKQKKENRDNVSFFSVFQIKKKVFASRKVLKKIPFFRLRFTTENQAFFRSYLRLLVIGFYVITIFIQFCHPLCNRAQTSGSLPLNITSTLYDPSTSHLQILSHKFSRVKRSNKTISEDTLSSFLQTVSCYVFDLDQCHQISYEKLGLSYKIQQNYFEVMNTFSQFYK